MQEIREPGSTLPVVFSADVAVCGGGPAGLMAAVAAARSGARTLLIERYGFLGGMATAGLVGPMSKFNCKGKPIVGGIPRELVTRMAARNGAIPDLPSGNVPFNAEVYKLEAQRLAREAGVHLLLHSYVAGAIADSTSAGRLTHVIIENKSGRCAVAAKVFVDCTGDADLTARAGFSFELGDGPGTPLQPLSLFFRLGGADTEHMERLLMALDGTRYYHKELHDAMEEARQAGMLPNFGGPWVVHGSTMQSGEVSVNATRVVANAVDAASLTNAECQAREDMHAIIALFKEKLPQLADAYLVESAPQVGIRETRRVHGLYTLTSEDVLAHRAFADTVALGAHPIDIHSATDSTQKAVFLSEPYGIPYRTMVPLGAHNLLVAGRSISTTREAFATIRVQAQCMALGEAAGSAAAMAAQQSISVAAIDAQALRQHLSNNGAIVDTP
jgi:hypothetical protein